MGWIPKWGPLLVRAASCRKWTRFSALNDTLLRSIGGPGRAIWVHALGYKKPMQGRRHPSLQRGRAATSRFGFRPAGGPNGGAFPARRQSFKRDPVREGSRRKLRSTGRRPGVSQPRPTHAGRRAAQAAPGDGCHVGEPRPGEVGPGAAASELALAGEHQEEARRTGK